MSGLRTKHGFRGHVNSLSSTGPRGVRCVNVDTGAERQVSTFNAWHAISNRTGTCMVADTNFPDIGIQIFDPRDGIGEPRTLCYPGASSLGEHWNGPLPVCERSRTGLCTSTYTSASIFQSRRTTCRIHIRSEWICSNL